MLACDLFLENRQQMIGCCVKCVGWLWLAFSFAHNSVNFNARNLIFISFEPAFHALSDYLVFFDVFPRQRIPPFASRDVYMVGFVKKWLREDFWTVDDLIEELNLWSEVPGHHLSSFPQAGSRIPDGLDLFCNE